MPLYLEDSRIKKPVFVAQIQTELMRGFVKKQCHLARHERQNLLRAVSVVIVLEQKRNFIAKAVRKGNLAKIILHKRIGAKIVKCCPHDLEKQISVFAKSTCHALAIKANDVIRTDFKSKVE